MRIPIFYDRSSLPYVRAQIRWDLTGARASVNLVVDTGAYDLTISMWDLQILEGARDRLSRSDFQVSGLGGPADTFRMKGLSIVFIEGGPGEAKFLLDDAVVLDDSKPACDTGHPLQIPSLLGRKFMEDHGFILHWDFARRIAYIDMAEPSARTGWRPSHSTS